MFWTALLLGYILTATILWKLTFNKTFAESLAPVFFVQILLSLFCGIVLSHVSYGIVVGIVIISVDFCWNIYRYLKNTKDKSFSQLVIAIIVQLNDVGIYVFLIAFVLCYIFNYHRYFSEWDEFSHWGCFLKETLRLDRLYCLSPASMAHKDYVPAVTIFEAFWCKFCMRYYESDAYRAIQMLAFSMVMPAIVDAESHVALNIATGNLNQVQCKIQYKNIFFALVKMAIFVVIPVFTPFKFYYTIYVDALLGYLLFYCIFLVLKHPTNGKYTPHELSRKFFIQVGKNEMQYDIFVLALSLTILILTKEIAIVFVMMIIGGYILKWLIFNWKQLKNIAWTVVLFVPVVVWIFVNKYIFLYVDNSGDQSLGGIKLSNIIGIVTHNGSVAWQHDVESMFLKYLFLRTIVGHFPYAFWIVGLSLALILVAIVVKRKIYLVTGLWIVICGTGYAVVMWITYLMAFSEYEARKLASYERYMATFVIACILLACSTLLLDVTINLANISWLGIIGAILVISSIAHHFNDVYPGFLRKDMQREHWEKLGMAEKIIQFTPDTPDTCVYMLDCGDNGSDMVRVNYFSLPRTVDYGSIGPARYDGDVFSNDLSCNEFVELIGKYDYLYSYKVDDVFLDKYSKTFENVELLKDVNVFAVKIAKGRIVLEGVE